MPLKEPIFRIEKINKAKQKSKASLDPLSYSNYSASLKKISDPLSQMKPVSSFGYPTKNKKTTNTKKETTTQKETVPLKETNPLEKKEENKDNTKTEEKVQNPDNKETKNEFPDYNYKVVLDQDFADR